MNELRRVGMRSGTLEVRRDCRTLLATQKKTCLSGTLLPMREIEMSARIGAMIVNAAAAQGVSPAVLQDAIGFAVETAADPDARIPLSMEEALWNEAARLTHDDAIGLHAAERLQPGEFDVLDYVVRTAPTWRQALERLVRYNRLEHDAAVFTLQHGLDTLRVEHQFKPGFGVQCRHSAEFTLGSLVIFGAQITGGPLAPVSIEFRHAAPQSTIEHERIFGTAPRFGAPINAVEWTLEQVQRPTVTADAALSRIIERHALAILAARPEPHASYADRVRHDIAQHVGHADISMKSVAARLKLSERSLQRRLAEESITFDALLDSLRQQLALRLLEDPKLAISEVAYLLGYSEPSPFYRAFRRWTGKTPRDVRRVASED